MANVELGEGDLDDVSVGPAYGGEGEDALEALGGRAPQQEERVGGRGRRAGAGGRRSRNLQLVGMVHIPVVRAVTYCRERRQAGNVVRNVLTDRQTCSERYRQTDRLL